MTDKSHKLSHQINKNPEESFITLKNTFSHWHIGKWYLKDYGMVEKELDGFDFVYIYFFVTLIK